MDMKLPLRYFLIISILLGAVAIPVGWRSYQKWRADKIERLEKELAELLYNDPRPGVPHFSDAPIPSPSPTQVAERKRWEQRVEQIINRLKHDVCDRKISE